MQKNAPFYRHFTQFLALYCMKPVRFAVFLPNGLTNGRKHGIVTDNRKKPPGALPGQMVEAQSSGVSRGAKGRRRPPRRKGSFAEAHRPALQGCALGRRIRSGELSRMWRAIMGNQAQGFIPLPQLP